MWAEGCGGDSHRKAEARGVRKSPHYICAGHESGDEGLLVHRHHVSKSLLEVVSRPTQLLLQVTRPGISKSGGPPLQGCHLLVNAHGPEVRESEWSGHRVVSLMPHLAPVPGNCDPGV